MQTLYPLCSIALQRSPGEEEQEVDSSSADVGQSFEYELCIQQVRKAVWTSMSRYMCMPMTFCSMTSYILLWGHNLCAHVACVLAYCKANDTF